LFGTTLLGKPKWGKTAFLIAFVFSILRETNPFWITLKFVGLLSFYEIPNLMNYFKGILDSYTGYQGHHTTELLHLQRTLDDNIIYVLQLMTSILLITWIFVFLADRFSLDLGGGISSTIPLAIIILLVLLSILRKDQSQR
jgi:hypothetical protein